MTDREQYTPGPASGAQVRKDRRPNDDYKWTLILVRELRHAPQKVWQALTNPAHLREWAPFDADRSLDTVGTMAKLTKVGAPTPHVTETRGRADAPKALEYDWGRAGAGSGAEGGRNPRTCSEPTDGPTVPQGGTPEPFTKAGNKPRL